MMSTLSSQMTPQVVITTTWGVISEDKVDIIIIMTTLGLQSACNQCCQWQISQHRYVIWFNKMILNLSSWLRVRWIKIERPGQNGHHFVEAMFEYISLNIKFDWNIFQNVYLTLPMSTYCQIDSRSTLVQVMVWCHWGDKPTPDAMLTQIHKSIWCYGVTVR